MLKPFVYSRMLLLIGLNFSLQLLAEKNDLKNIYGAQDVKVLQEVKATSVCSLSEIPERKKLVYLSPFSRLEEKKQIQILTKWISESKDYENKHNIEKRLVRNANQNEGIFSVNGGYEQKFMPGIIKVIEKTKDCLEFKNLWRLNQIHFEENRCQERAQEQVGASCCAWFAKRKRVYQPVVPRIISWADGPQECFMFEEMAQGVTVQVYMAELRSARKVEFYEKIGKMAAAFHFRVTEDSSKNLSEALLWSHGDFHIGNIIYDEKKDQFTLIDLDRMKQSMGIENSSLVYDYHQITKRNLYVREWIRKLQPFLDMYFADSNDKIDISLRSLSESERSLLLVHFILNDANEKMENQKIIDWYSQAPKRAKDRVLPPYGILKEEFNELNKELPNFHGFIHGYLKNTPPQLVSSVEEQFKSICNEIPEALFSAMRIQGDDWKKVQNAFLQGPLERLSNCRAGKFE